MQTATSNNCNAMPTRVYSHYLSSQPPAHRPNPVRNLNGAALILDGQEVPITEAMIQNALEELLR